MQPAMYMCIFLQIWFSTDKGPRTGLLHTKASSQTPSVIGVAYGAVRGAYAYNQQSPLGNAPVC